MSLKEDFNSVKPRENAGPRSSDRFHYQKDWALCELFKLHLSDDDYLIGLDIHDDVIVFDSAEDPTTIRFYQVKTTEADSITLGRMTSRKNGANGTLPSMLGKLYYNAIIFPKHAERLTLVSNAPFKLALDADGRTATVLPSGDQPFSAVCLKNKEAIVGALKEEHKLDAAPALDQLLWFQHSDIPLGGHSTHAKGKLVEFFSSWNSKAIYNPDLVYTAFIDHIRKKNDYSGGQLTFEQARQLKGICKAEFDEMLASVIPDEDFESKWIQVQSDLQGEGFDFGERRSLRRAWQRVEASRADVSKADFRDVKDALNRITAWEHPTVLASLSDGLPKLRNALRLDLRFDDDFLRAALLMKLHDLI